MKLIDRIKWIKDHMKYPVLLVKGEELEEVEEALNQKEKYEMQWLDDINNPLEPIKISSALRSEIMKLEYRLQNKPKDVSPLDYTIIYCLKKCLDEVEE